MNTPYRVETFRETLATVTSILVWAALAGSLLVAVGAASSTAALCAVACLCTQAILLSR